MSEAAVIEHDAIVVGSGFGGAVTACRLAEAGFGVLVLERGRRWSPETFPREPDDPWLWDHTHPEKRHGWLDLRVFPKMAVAAGCGVGGGSLIYANVSIDAKSDTFAAGWPPEITFAGLAPYYAAVKAMLDSRPIPATQWTRRTKLVREAAERTGNAARFRTLDLAVSFDDDWRYDLPGDPHDEGHSRRFVNRFGRPQGTCVHLGTCDIGCKVNARNTLDLNYLARAEALGTEVRALHLVRSISPIDGGYSVAFDRIADGVLVPGRVGGRIVILAAGSLGSTEILLRCRDLYQTLPHLSPRLGRGWSANGDFLTPAVHLLRQVDPTRGPTITAAIDFLQEHGVFVEDGGLPDVLGSYLSRLEAGDSGLHVVRAVVATVRALLAGPGGVDHVMPWFAQSRDAADGTLSLVGGRLVLDWDPSGSAAAIDAVIDRHKELAKASGGLPLVPPTWSVDRWLITPHPLGGCAMGRSSEDGVVDHRGEVFGHPNLYVADGAIVPKAIGLNPSKTIAALAERIAAILVEEKRA